jgi:hypothetical protein
VDILQRGDEMDCWIFAEVEFAWQHSHWKPGMLWGHKYAIVIAFGLCFFSDVERIRLHSSGVAHGTLLDGSGRDGGGDSRLPGNANRLGTSRPGTGARTQPAPH